MEEKGTDNRAQDMVYRKEMELSCKEPECLEKKAYVIVTFWLVNSPDTC